jgi:CBS domain-containing protein
MLDQEFCQLPIIDESGELIGLISDEVISHRYFHLHGEVPLLDLTVDHCLTPAVTLTKDRDIFEALDRLKDVYAIVIVEDNTGLQRAVCHSTHQASFARAVYQTDAAFRQGLAHLVGGSVVSRVDAIGRTAIDTDRL